MISRTKVTRVSNREAQWTTTPRKLPLAPVRPGRKRGLRSRRMLRKGEVCPRRPPLENSDQTCPLTRSLYPAALPERGPHKGHAETQDDQNHSSRRTEPPDGRPTQTVTPLPLPTSAVAGVEFWDWGCQSHSATALQRKLAVSPRCGWGVSQSIQWRELEAEASRMIPRLKLGSWAELREWRAGPMTGNDGEARRGAVPGFRGQEARRVQMDGLQLLSVCSQLPGVLKSKSLYIDKLANPRYGLSLVQSHIWRFLPSLYEVRTPC